MLTIVCVKQGTLYDAGYVNKLWTMVARNLDAGTEGRFICYTDDPTGIRQEIQCRELPDGMAGWWCKLFLFAPGQFDEGDRIVYFDLDTVIIDAIDDIVKYDGPFAILRDFYRPDGWQSAVMAWVAGFGTHIWKWWENEGRPTTNPSDQEWIEGCLPDADIWQDLCPGKFVSFKEHCIPFPPDGASVVVFHGEPRPHNCGRAWVNAMWSESNVGHFALAVTANVPLATVRDQIRHSAGLGLPRLTSKPAHGREVAIVGGGPSLGDCITVSELRRLEKRGGAVWAINGSYNWLRDHGITAEAHVLLDARADNERFLYRTREETTHYVASQCHPAIFKALMICCRKIVRIDLDVMGDCGTTVGTHALAVAFTEGYRRIHLFGFDSSYRGDAGHAYAQPLNDADQLVNAHAGDRTFRAAPWMVRQAQDFQDMGPVLIAAGAEITVHGDGLLPHVARMMAVSPTVRVAA